MGYLENITNENKNSANNTKQVMEERDELRKNKESVEAKAQNKVDKAPKLYD